jgi:ubiquinone/menaquinone biosynthesis C-methylase UbiE
MLREIAHFVRVSPEVMKLQKEMSQAELLDAMTARADAEGFATLRQRLVGDLAGRVLEVGCGTGAMFGYYPDAVTEVHAIEPDADFRALALEKAEATGGRIRAVEGDGMALDFPDASFDAVVFGLVLCSVPSVDRVVGEAFRVLRPGGHFRALEHVRSTRLVAGTLMNVLNPVWLALNKQGCNWNRDPVPSITGAGLALDECRDLQLFDTVMPAFPLKEIYARRPQA